MAEKNNNYILIGMPGSGKSTIGVLLAKALGYDFVDTDLVIQQKRNDGCFLSTSNKVKAAAVLPSAAFFLSFCSSVQEPHSPGSPRHSVIASCCSGVNARCRGL